MAIKVIKQDPEKFARMAFEDAVRARACRASVQRSNRIAKSIWLFVVGVMFFFGAIVIAYFVIR